LELSQFAKKIIDLGTGRARSAGLAIRLTEPDPTPIFSTARTLWPAGFTDVDFGLGVSLADEAARGRASVSFRRDQPQRAGRAA